MQRVFKPGDSCLVAQGEALHMVQAVVQQAVAQEWRPLPHTMRKAATFQDSVNALVFDVLMDKVPFPTDQAIIITTTTMITVTIMITITITVTVTIVDKYNNVVF